jgi:hypothetical protein
MATKEITTLKTLLFYVHLATELLTKLNHLKKPSKTLRIDTKKYKSKTKG